MKITRMDRPQHQTLSAAFVKALKATCDEYGVDVREFGGQLGEGTGIIKLQVTVRDNGSGVSGAKAQFERYAAFIGLKPEDFGRRFMFRGHPYEISGAKPSSPKYNMEAKRVYDGRICGFSGHHVATLLLASPMKRAA